jgi:tetratricopeptide (TPR) repeat protein
LTLSNICVSQQQHAEAEEWLEQVLDEFPEDIGALNDLGYLWTEQNKNLTRALSMIQKAVEGDSENVAYVDSLGWVYYRLGRFEEAVTELEKAVSLTDDPDGVILDHLADAYIKTNRKDKAIQTWRRAVKSFEKDKDAEKRKATLEKIKQHEK